MNIGDLVRNKNSKLGEKGLLLRWRTFDPETNPYTCPEVMWFNGRISSIQHDLLEVIGCELSDDDLDAVRGGMNSQRFSEWRAEYLNESK